MSKENGTKSVNDCIETMQNKEGEEDNIVIKSQFIKSIISKLISSTVSKKLKYAVDFKVNELGVAVASKNIHIHLAVDATLDKNDLMKIINI